MRRRLDAEAEMFWSDNAQAEEALFLLRRRAGAVMTVVCWLLLLVAVGFASIHGEWRACFMVGLPLVTAATCVHWRYGATLFSRIAIAVIFMLLSGLLIHESHGLIESHFSIFALIAFLLYYRDWRPIAAAAVTIAVHHYVACELQMRGYGVFVFPPGHPCTMVWVHAAYVVIEAAVLMYLSELIQREALETAAISAFGRRMLETGVIDLNVDACSGVKSPALEELLRALNRTVKGAGLAAGGMNDVSGDVLTAAREVLSTGHEQETSSRRAVLAVRHMTETTEDVSRNCREMAATALDSADMVRDGREMLQRTATSIKVLLNTVIQVSTQMSELQAESKRIEGIITIMADVAEQTELLALNATIEAARAGEAGKTFHVVAQEIRGLSLRTHHSLSQVRQRVDAVREKTEGMCVVTEECRLEALKGGSQVETAVTTLETVAEQLPQLAMRANEMIARAQEYGSLSADAVEEMQQIEHSTTVNSSCLQRIEVLVRSLKEMSEALVESVASFQPGEPSSC